MAVSNTTAFTVVKIPQAHKACISNLVQVPERAVHWGTVHMLVLGHGEKHSEEGIGTHTNNSQCDYGSYIVLKSCALHMTRYSCHSKWIGMVVILELACYL